jgi:hypothetical protein
MPRCRTPASLYLSDMQAKVSVSNWGVVALPAARLIAAGIRTQSGIIAETTAEGILLRPAETPSVEIYIQERIAEFDTAESGLEKAVERDGRPEKPAWIPLADEALKRAALQGRDVAIQTNTGILVMVDGKMVKITAEELRAERDKGGASSQNSGAKGSEGEPR